MQAKGLHGTLHEKLPLYHAFDICQRCQRPYLTNTFDHFWCDSKAIFDLSQMWYTCDLNQKWSQRFCQILLVRASRYLSSPLTCVEGMITLTQVKVVSKPMSKVLLTNTFDSCVKDNGPTLIRFWCKSKSVKAKFSCTGSSDIIWEHPPSG